MNLRFRDTPGGSHALSQGRRVSRCPDPARGVEPDGRVNWAYESSSQTIRFEPAAAPGLGQEVRVEYPTVCS